MTTEEAIERLEDIFEGWESWNPHNDSPASQMAEALGIAIDALRAQHGKASQYYTFTVRLCDNEVDRDFERFTVEALGQLAKLYVGKAGVFQMETPFGQRTLRITRTEVIHEPSKVTQFGDEYCWLKAWVDIPRTPENEELICALESDLKREVSIGCSVSRSVCSICGSEAGTCQHVKGQAYNGKLCFMELTNPKDAYEWAFITCPQRACDHEEDDHA